MVNCSLVNRSHLCEPAWMVHPTALTVWFWMMLTLNITGGITNIGLLWVIISNKKLRTGSGFLIAHLLFIEAQLCIVHMFILSITTYYIVPYTALSDTFCRYTLIGYYSSIYALNWTALMIGINRFVAVFFPHKYSLWSKQSVVVTMAVLSWAIALTLNFLEFTGTILKHEATPPWGTCGIIVFRMSSYLAMVSFAQAGPVSLLGALYLIILGGIGIRTIQHHRKVREGSSGKGAATVNSSLMRRRYRSAVMLFVAYLWYTSCLMPAPVAATLYPLQYTSYPLLSLFLRALLLFGYATNPVSRTPSETNLYSISFKANTTAVFPKC